MKLKRKVLNKKDFVLTSEKISFLCWVNFIVRVHIVIRPSSTYKALSKDFCKTNIFTYKSKPCANVR